MLREMIDNKGKSVYAVAKESGIPYTTLNELVMGKKKISECSLKTIAALAAYFNMSIDNLYRDLRGTSPIITVNQTWLQQKRKKFKFPLIQESTHYDATRVHPLKQKLIFTLAEKLMEGQKVDYAILFGGSTTIRCNRKSDVDIAVALKREALTAENKTEISEMIQQICNSNADIVWIDQIEPDSKLAGSLERGVLIR